MTIVEILIAAIVLTIGLLASAQLVIGSESTSVDAELQQIATAEAENRVEEIISLPYDQIGHADVPSNLESRATTTTFTSPGAGTEELVIAANDEAGDSVNGVLAATGPEDLRQVDPISITVGGATFTGNAYTYVTWRDEECEAVDLTGLQAGIEGLRDDLGGLRNRLSALVTLVNDNLVIALLPSAVRSIYSSLVPGLISDLDDSVDELDALLGVIANAEVDLCDLSQEAVDAIDGLVDPDGVGGFEASADVLGVTAGISSEATFNVPVLGPPLSCIALLPLFNAFCNESNGLQTEIGTSGIGATLTGVDADAQALAANLSNDTTHNTKRITVGIDLDTRADQTPQNIVWVSQIVSDPDEGLL